MSEKPCGVQYRNINRTMKTRCDVCGKGRGGNRPVSHAKCSAIRKQRGFSGSEPYEV